MKGKIPGILLASVIGIISFLLALFIAKTLAFRISSVLIGLIAGVIMANTIGVSAQLKPGVNYSAKKILEWAIILLGFGITVQSIGALGWQSLVIIVVLILVILLLTILFSKKLNSQQSTNLMVGFGTAICGSSAIAAVSSLVSEDEKDTGIAVAVVNFLGLIGMVGFPAVFAFISVEPNEAGTLIGGSLQAVGNVAGAGYALSDEIGNIALTVKLGRVAMLAPAVILFNILLGKKGSFLSYFKLPYYIWGFIAATLIASFVPIPLEILGYLKMAGKIVLTIAMVGIGLKISIKDLLGSGKSALGFGVLIFAIQIAVVVGLIKFLL